MSAPQPLFSATVNVRSPSAVSSQQGDLTETARKKRIFNRSVCASPRSQQKIAFFRAHRRPGKPGTAEIHPEPTPGAGTKRQISSAWSKSDNWYLPAAAGVDRLC